jgi:WD40 repeat protein/serine/threonine protein kinase
VRLEEGAAPVEGFTLVTRLGRGGFGEVWQAVGPGGFQVAMKFIRLEESAGTVELRSLELTKQVKHPNLLAQFGAWERDGYLIIAMELGNGTLYEQLKAAVKSGKPGLPREQLLEYMREAAKAIDYLNGLNIQHRDIKPQNLLLVGNGVKVADFGLAKVLEHSVGAASGSMTPAYAAPEFFNGQATRWSDQYCLAMTYYQLRCNALPFTGNAAQIVAGHLTRPPDLSLLPPEERPILERALSKQPQSRWPNCLTFVEALQSVTPTQPGSYLRPTAFPPQAGISTTSEMSHARTPPPMPPRSGKVAPARPTPPPLPGRKRSKVGLAVVLLFLALLLGGGAGVGALWLMKPRTPGDKPTQVAQRAATTKETSPLGTASKPTLTTAPKPGILLPILSPVVLEPGRRTTVTVKLARIHCPGPIEVRLTNLPDGVTSSNVTLGADSQSATLELTAREDAKPVVQQANLEARSLLHGTVTAKMSFKMEIKALATALRLRYLPDLTLMAGKSTTVVVRVERTNCPGDLPLRWEGLPAGVTVSPSQIPGNVDLLTVTLRASSNAPVGRHNLRLRAGQIRHRAQVSTTLALLPYTPPEDFSLALTPEGPRYLAWYYDAPRQTTWALLVDLTTGKPLSTPYRMAATTGFLRGSKDGRRLAIAPTLARSQNMDLYVMDTSTGRWAGPAIRLEDRLRSMALSPEGRYLYATVGSHLHCWEVATGKLHWKVTKEGDALRLAVSPHGRWLAGCIRGKLQIWDTSNGQLRHSIEAHKSTIGHIVFSNDSQRLATASMDRSACIFDTATGNKVATLEHQGVVHWICFSPHQQRVATASSDRTAKIWDGTNGKELSSLPHENGVMRVEFSDDGERLFTAETQQTLEWNSNTGQKINAPVRRHPLAMIGPFREEPTKVGDGAWQVVVRLWDNTLRLWNTDRQQAVTAPLDHPDFVHFTLLAPNGRELLACSRDGTARVWNILTGRPLTPYRKHKEMVIRGLFSPDGRTVATLSRSEVKLWSATSNTAPGLANVTLTANDVAFSPDSARLAILGNDKTLALYDTRSGKEVWKITLTEACLRVYFTDDGQQLHFDAGKKQRIEAATGKSL